MTGRDLVEAVLRKLGALAAGESASGAEASQGLEEMNRMLSSWSTNDLTIYQVVTESHTLVANTAAYTMGVGGDINTSRPIEIQKAWIRDSTGGEPIDYPIQLLSVDQWARIGAKSVTTTYPNSLFDDGGNPLRTLTLYPVPSANHSLYLMSLKPLSSIATLSTTIAFPPGYEDAMVYNGALRLASEYGKIVTPTVKEHAVEGLANIKRANKRVHLLRVDPMLSNPRGKKFNYRTGDYNR